MKTKPFIGTNLTNLRKESKNFNSAVIVDLGGVLAWRGSRPKESFLERFLEDSIDEKMRDLVNLLHSSGQMIIILTGQWECSRGITTQWLNMHNVKHHTLIMKSDKAGQDGVDTLDFKEGIYENVLKDLINITFVLEDREQVVEMWRSKGLKCLQPASGQDRELYQAQAKRKLKQA